MVRPYMTSFIGCCDSNWNQGILCTQVKGVLCDLDVAKGGNTLVSKDSRLESVGPLLLIDRIIGDMDGTPLSVTLPQLSDPQAAPCLGGF